MNHTRIFIFTMIAATTILCSFFCGDLPVDPLNDPIHAAVNLFFIDNGESEITFGATRRLGCRVTNPQYLSTITISSTCGGIDTSISAQHIANGGVIDFSTTFREASICLLIARATMKNSEFDDRIDTLTVSVLEKPDTTDTTTTESPLIPSTVYAPERIVSGTADTLVFAVNTMSEATAYTIAMITDESLDPAVFSVVPSSEDSILIAISPEAVEDSAHFGIIVSNGKDTDTTWYPVSIIPQAEALWVTGEVPVEAPEGIETQFDLNPYLLIPNAVISSDIGMILEGNIWSYTPPWGAEETGRAQLTAKTAEVSMILTLNIAVPAGDIAPPTLILQPPLTDGKRISAQQISITCTAKDTESGVASVVFTYGEQHIDAVPQEDNNYTGVISGLEHTIPAEITITATDRSQTKNRAQLVFFIIYDSTLNDIDLPIITKLNGPAQNDRVRTAEGTISYTVKDDSGVDSVWWTLNSVFAGALSLQNDGTYMVSYALSTFGENSITLHAQDAAANRNSNQHSISIVYNVSPTVPDIITPEAGGMSISTAPTLTWTGGDDPDRDQVFYRILYRKSSETVDVTSEEIKEKIGKLNALEPNTEYTWSVIAYTKTYHDTVRSANAKFTTAGTGPAIVKQPSSPGTIAPGGKFTLTVVVTGNPEPTYQWYKNGKILKGHTDATFSVTNATAGDAGEYYVIVDNGVGQAAKSSTVSIAVKRRVEIIADPESQEVIAGESVSFTVMVSGDGPFTYQWQKDGTPLVGQTAATCKLTSVTINQAGTYTCIVKNSVNEVTSGGATLTVTPTCTLTYSANGGTGPVPATQQYPSGATAMVEGPSSSLTKSNGSTCLGWGDGKTMYYNGSTITMTRDITLWAVWQATVTFDYQDNNKKVQVTVIEGQALDPGKIPTPSVNSNGAPFNGWYTAPSGGSPFNTVSTISKSMTVYAQWKAIYTVTYNGGGAAGTVPTDSNTYSSGEYATVLSKGGLSKSGYAFNGWKDSTGKTYAEKSTILMTGNVTLTAQWKIIQYTVTFDADGGIPSPETVTVDAGTSLGSKFPQDPEKEGYSFTGWYNGATKITASTLITSTLKVMAGWKALPAPPVYAYYPFSGNARDASGNGHDCTVSGAVLTQDRHGKSNSAYLFDGIDDYVQLKPMTDFPSGNVPRTLAGWFRSSSNDDEAYMMLFGFGSTQNTYNFQVGSGPCPGAFHFRVNGWGTPYDWCTGITSAQSYDGQWHHCAVTYDGSTTSFYLDGALKAQTADFQYVCDSTTMTLVIGREIDLEGWEFEGALDDIYIYTGALTAEEIQKLYNSQK